MKRWTTPSTSRISQRRKSAQDPAVTTSSSGIRTWLQDAFSRKPIRIGCDILIGLALAATLAHVIIVHQERQTAEATVCRAPGRRIEVRVAAEKFSEQSVSMALCDSLVITDTGSEAYLLTFGTYDKHFDYPGFTPQVQTTNESISIDGLKAGQYELHDHLRDKAVLRISIGQKKR